MAATILIKRTQGTSPPTAAPVGTGVSFGELVYTYDTSDVGAGKSYKKLYIGNPAGPTQPPIVVGGEYYTQMLPENPADFGKPVASKAVILNPSGQVVSWNVQTDLNVGASATVTSDLTVGGNLNVTGDLTYDEVNARNWNITGVGTIPTLYVTDITDTLNLQSKVGIISALSGVGGTFNDFNSTSAQFEQINVSHASTTKNLTVTGIATIEDNVDFRTQLIRIGREAGELETDGTDRQGFFIGNWAGQQAGLGNNTKRNIAIGHSAFQKGGKTKAESNLFLGHFAGQEAEGSHNIYIGDKVGQDLGSQSVITYGETGNASTISFSDGSSLGNDPYAYRVYGTTDNFSNLQGGDWAFEISQLGDLGTINSAVTGNLSFNIGTCTNAHLGKLIGQQFKVKGQDNFALLTDNNDAIYLSGGSIGLTDTYGFIVVRSGITTNSGKEDHDQNIGIGREALWGAGISTNQSNNIAIGAFALYNVYGSDNVAIGNSAGANNTGSNNVIIGKGQDVRYPDQDDQLVIGSGDVKWVSGNSDGWVGVGTTTPTALLDVDGDVNITGVATVPQLDVNNLGIEDIKITAGLATDLAVTNLVNSVGIITNAYIDVGVVTSLVGTYATITVFDTETADLRDVKITAGIITDIVGTAATITTIDATVTDIIHGNIVAGVITSITGIYATITNFDTELADLKDVKITSGIITDIVGTAATITTIDATEGDIVNAKITAGIITSQVGTYATITVFDTETADLRDVKITAGIITDIVGTAATITTIDATEGDIVNAKITAGVVTSLVGTYSTIQDVNITHDFRVGGASTFVGNVTFQGGVIGLGDSTSDAIVFNADIDSSFIPDDDDTYNLGAATQQWKDLHIDGTAYIDDLSVDSTVGVYATITTFDTETADLKDVKITSGIITDIVGTAATITTIDATEGDIVNAKITAGVVTSIVGTYATITNFDTETADLKDVKITAGIITDIVGTAASITTIDVTEGDIVNAKITAGVITSIVGTYGTITTLDVETLDAQSLSITGVAATDIVGTAASITTIDVTNMDVNDVKVLAGLATDFAITNLVTQVGIATSAFITSGFMTSLYDSTGVVGVNTQHVLSTNTDGTITWREPAQVGIATVNPADDVWFVDTHGVDAYDASRGRTVDRPFRSIRYALSRISNRYEHTYNGGTATNAVNVQSGAESGNQKSPNGATYNEQTGELTLAFGSAHGLSTNDTITLDNNSLSFTCTMDGNTASKTYPRAGSDPIAGVTTAVTVLTTTSLKINVNVSPIIRGVNEILNIGGGVYEETFPLYVPDGLTVKGAGLRATKIKPTVATKQKDCFLMNDRTVVEDVTISDMYFDTAGNQGFAFKYQPGIAITSRSPYVQRVTVFNKGTNQTAADPYGFGSADSAPSSYISGAGAYVDGSQAQSSSLEAAMLFNEVTFIVPNNKGIVMTNGARVEFLNCFTYFASEGIRGESGTVGLSSAGKTRLRLTGITTTSALGIGNTITYYDTDAVTGLATAVVAGYDGTYLDVTGKQTGFEIINNRTAKTLTFNGHAQLDTTVKKFGSASLKLDGTNDSVSAASHDQFGFGTDEFAVGFWVYRNSTGLTSATALDFRDSGTDASGLSIAFRGSEYDVRVGNTTALSAASAGITTGAWHHIAVAKVGTKLIAYSNGAKRAEATSYSTDLGLQKPVVIGADFDGAANAVTGWFDDVFVQKGLHPFPDGAYTYGYSAEAAGNRKTSLLVNFNGTNGVTTATDNVAVTQDIRITQPNSGVGTASKIILADYSQFGADMRSVGCAVEYGQKGVVADGDGVTLRCFALNFNHVGSGGDITNDPNLAIQANEVTQVNNGDVSFVSIDQKGDFRVGDAFYVDQENGTVAFSQQVTSLQALSNLTVSDSSGNSSQITPTSGTFGNIQIAGNNIESTTGDINIDPAGAGDINITGDVNVLGILTATVIQLDAFQKGDTSIALTDSGSDGTIVSSTENTEAMRIDANQKIGIGTATVRDRLDVLDTARFERINATGVVTVSSSADVNNLDAVDAKIATGLATNFTVGQTRGDGSLTINSPVGLNSHTDVPDNVEFRVGENSDFKFYHQDTDAFANRGHSIIQHSNGNATYGRLQIRSDYFSVQTATGNSDFLMADSKTVKLMYADTAASGDGARLIVRASGSEMLGIVTFKDNGVYKGEVAIGSSITATAGVVTANAVDLADADILDAKITAGLATDFAITNARIQTGIATEMTFAGFSTFVGIATFQDDIYIAGNLNVIGDVVYDEVNGRNIKITGISTFNEVVVVGVTTIFDIKIGAGSSTTKIETNSGELVLDSAAGQVTVQDNFQVVGYGTFKNGLYYRSDQDGSTGIGYSGPNGMGYFEADGRLVSTASTVGFLTTSNYVMTTNAGGVPTWTDSIDGGFF